MELGAKALLKNVGKNVCLHGSVCGEPDCTNCAMNSAQKETYEMLLSEVEGIEIAPAENGAIVFEGYGQDGPSIGYIETDGKVSWIVAG